VATGPTWRFNTRNKGRAALTPLHRISKETIRAYLSAGPMNSDVPPTDSTSVNSYTALRQYVYNIVIIVSTTTSSK